MWEVWRNFTRGIVKVCGCVGDSEVQEAEVEDRWTALSPLRRLHRVSSFLNLDTCARTNARRHAAACSGVGTPVRV